MFTELHLRNAEALMQTATSHSEMVRLMNLVSRLRRELKSQA